jgi:hypothetical protein
MQLISLAVDMLKFEFELELTIFPPIKYASLTTKLIDLEKRWKFFKVSYCDEKNVGYR